MRHVGVQALACHAGEHSRLKPVLQRFLRNSGEGPHLNRFSFHETDCLAQDLAKLLQQATAFKAASESCQNSSWSPSSSRAVIPGIILLYSNQPCAAIGYSIEPSETVTISSPVILIDASDHVRRELCEVLLNRLKQRSVEAGFRQINFLQLDSDIDPVFMTLLAEQSFLPAARILQWKLATSTSSAEQQIARNRSDTTIARRQDDYTIHRFDMTHADTREVCQVQSALNVILKSSDDLPGQRRPQADELLARWHSLQAHVFTCRMHGSIAGIISLANCAGLGSDFDNVMASAAESESYVSLEYIGVVSEFRRRKLASWLIAQIPLLLGSDIGNATADKAATRDETSAASVKVFSDAANTPASALYQNLGFHVVGEMSLWCCPLMAG